MKYRYPCTGNVGIMGFGKYLEREIAEPRRNIRLFASELKERFGGAFHCLVNSGSSANLVAAFAAAEKLKARGMPLTAVASAFTFPTTMSALAFAGFSVKIVDVAEDDDVHVLLVQLVDFGVEIFQQQRHQCADLFL